MISRQYRIERQGKGYQVRVTFGLLDSPLIYAGRVYQTQREAKIAASKHAEDTCVKPIILR